MNLSDIIAINICKQGSDNMRIAICDDELIASGSKPDILFLDIQMPGMDGMETAKVLRQDNEDMILIFVTAAEEYVFQAYG
jgi:DNA-binding LytR/AlgR family response regulator